MKKILQFSLVLMMSLAHAASPDPANYYNDRLLICLQPDLSIGEIATRGSVPITGIASLDQLLELRGITSMEKYLPAATPDDIDEDIVLSNIYRIGISPGRSSIEQLITDFQTLGSILYAEQEAISRPLYTPNDSRYSQQWYMQKVEAPAAWDFWDIAGGDYPGNINIILASVDTGVQYTHPDLWQRAWVNQAEIPATIFASVDTDNDGIVTPVEIVAAVTNYNGDSFTNLQDALHPNSPFMDGIDGDDWDNNPTTYVDDLLGWDVAGTTSGNDPDNDPMGAFTGPSDAGTRMHGTHVAGLLAAATDNSTGIASVVYNATFMPVKVLYDQGDGGISGGYSGMLYAAKAGANILNMSWGGGGYSASDQATVNLIYDSYGALLVAAAGNGNDNGTPSSTPHYPSGYDHVVSVTALGSADNFSWANYGNGDGNTQFFGVDLSAPGENIHSTVFTTAGSYQSWDGTSMASPLVASCFGLLKAANPEQSNDWLVENMMSTADPIDDINPNFAGQLGAGRINIFSALAHNLYPQLSYDSYSLSLINDNGDNLLSPGEEARMRINLFNDPGWVDAGDVTGILRSNSPHVTITDSTGSYGDINNGNIGVNITDRFQFSIASDAPTGLFPFSLEVTANAATEHSYSAIIEFNVDVSMWQANFPITSSIIKGGNAIVDLDGNGSPEIIFGAYDSLLHAIQVDGTELTGFPVSLNYLIEATPSIGDVDNDGDLEIVIGSLDRDLYVVQHDGAVESIYTSPGYILAPSALYDFDNDGDLEIVTASTNSGLNVMHHDGTSLDGWPIVLEHNVTVGAAIGDINADGNINIVVGSWGDRLHAFNVDGTEIPGFPVVLIDRVRSAPVLANIDGSADGSLEILFGSDGNKFFAFDASGSELWSVNTSGQNIQSDPAICDIDGDGDLEIVFGGLDRFIYVLDHTGAILEGWPVSTGGAIYSSPAIADIDNDGIGEIFIGSNDHKLYGLYLDGSNIGGFPTENSGNIQGSPSIADLDDDGDLEIVVGADDNLLVLDISGPGAAGGFWPTHRGNLQRTGALPTLVPVRDHEALPGRNVLYANFPNPFNPTTLISFEIPEAGIVNLQILDIRGRVVEVLVDAQVSAGIHSVAWAGRANGEPVSAGIYFYRLSTQNGNLVRKMTLLK